MLTAWQILTVVLAHSVFADFGTGPRGNQTEWVPAKQTLSDVSISRGTIHQISALINHHQSHIR